MVKNVAREKNKESNGRVNVDSTENQAEEEEDREDR